MNLNKNFLKFCNENQYEINQNQLEIIENLKDYYEVNFHQNLINRIFKKKDVNLGFYLVGTVGVGKTMILDFFFKQLNENKLRLHFNEFMIEFHDFIFANRNKNNGIDLFVNNLSKKAKLIYFDEFQVTNIVDAMILGKLFKRIFEKKVRVIFSSNTKIKDLYKDGLQRDQFIPFIKVLEKNSYEKELLIEEDYRSEKNNDLERFLFPINQSINFKFKKFFRKITKKKNQTYKIFEVKGRKLEIKNFYERVIKFDFEELCNKNLGSEDYITIASNSDFIFIENLPNFTENNSDQQQRFITLIDIIYEKKVPLMITSHVNLSKMTSSKNLIKPFQRTVSRLYELTSIRYN